jgi:hypothetical protein
VSVDFRWYEKDKTFLFTYSGQVTADELTRPIETIIRHLDVSADYIHVIVDWRHATDQPYFADFIFTGLKLLRHPRIGWLVIVGESRAVKLWVELFETVENFRYRIFPTFEEATQFLDNIVM